MGELVGSGSVGAGVHEMVGVFVGGCGVGGLVGWGSVGVGIKVALAVAVGESGTAVGAKVGSGVVV